MASELVKVLSDQTLPIAQLGKSIATIMIAHKLSDSDIHKHVWPALLNSCSRKEVVMGDLFPAHCVRGKVYWYTSRAQTFQ
jgi:hypothetical protein